MRIDGQNKTHIWYNFIFDSLAFSTSMLVAGCVQHVLLEFETNPTITATQSVQL